MARSTAEIQTDIEVTRRLIERELDAIERHVPHAWWTPYAILAGAVLAGFVLSRIPVLRVVDTGARTVRTGVTVASTLAAVNRFVAERRLAA